MNLQSACELLMEIEQKIDVNSMRYEGEYLWPLVRQFLWVGCIQGKFDNFVVPIEKEIKNISVNKPSFFDHIQHIATTNSLYKNLKRTLCIRRQLCYFPNKKIDIGFLSQPIYYSEVFNDKSYSRIIDPIYELLSPLYNCLKLEEAFKRDTLPQRAYSCRYFDVFPLRVDVDAKVLKVVCECDTVLRQISTIVGIKKTELTQGLTIGLRQALKYRDTYLLIFKKIQPKLFFITCYYFPAIMGLNWAAKMRNIPTIDLQHGKQGKFQGMYSHWTKIPEEGYSMLPTWFWSWGKSSVENIMNWQANRKKHRSLIGGYPWISRWNEIEFSTTHVVWPNAEKLILITTQAPGGGLDDFFPDILVDAIKQAPVNWRWIIREHPNYKQGNNIIKDKLKKIDGNCYVMDTYNKVPLYSLLSKCDFHITAYSSVCYEAEVFSVPTAIFSEVGMAMYAQEIEDGQFIYCEDGTSIINAISCFKAMENKEKYIESSNKLVFSALRSIERASNLS